MAVIVILSPHPDDAVFSLWHLLDGPGDVTVVNVFAGIPSSTDLGWWDAQTGAADPRSRARERAAEDRAALELAGRSPTDLAFLDLQYRVDNQPLEPIADAVTEAVPGEALLLAPAGLGGHLDHQLLRDAALALWRRGRRVALYADLPHASGDGWPPWVTNGSSASGGQATDAWRADMDGTGVELGELAARVHALTPSQASRKLAALAEYATQVPALTEQYELDRRPDALRYEIVWELPLEA
jgi:LmbE family N-acetylglucosaminyl deacetylase